MPAKLILLLAAVILTLAPALPAADAPEAGAVYEYRRLQHEVSPGGYRATVSEKVMILNERGQEYARLSLWESPYVRLKSVSIKVYDASGELAYERNKGDLEKTCGYDRIAFYSEDCHYYGAFELQKYPYSIEYQWVEESESLFFLSGCVFQLAVPVRESVFTLELKGSVRLNFKTYGLAAAVKPQKSADGLIYTWKLDSLPALSDIELITPGSQDPARLAITPADFSLEKYRFDGGSWLAIGKSLSQLFEDRYLPMSFSANPPTGKVAEDMALACYNSVRDDVRYVAIAVGLGGWRPHPAELTQQRRFGDCKDKSTLLVSRLRNVGVPAYPVHVLTRDHGPLDPEFPTIEFNHVITLAIVNNDSIWLDPTCDVCPFGDLPTNDRDIYVLAGSEDGGRLCRIPAAQPEQNLRTRSAQLHLRSDLALNLQLELTAVGSYAQYLRSVLPTLNRDQTAQFIQDLLPGGNKKFAVASFEIGALDSLDQPVAVRIKAELRKAAPRIGNIVYCTPFVLAALAGYETIDLDERTVPVSLNYPRTDVEKVTFTWDSSLMVDSIDLPAPDSLTLPFGDIRVETSRDGNQLCLSLSKRYSVNQILPEQFPAFTAFRDKLRDIHDRQIRITVKS